VLPNTAFPDPNDRGYEDDPMQVGGGNFIDDTLPEGKATELHAAVVGVEERP